MQNTESVALMKDHIGIAKFEDREDFDYKTVASLILMMAKEANSRIEERWIWYERHEGKQPRNIFELIIKSPFTRRFRSTTTKENGKQRER